MESFQARPFTAGGDLQQRPQQNQLPNPYHHQLHPPHLLSSSSSSHQSQASPNYSYPPLPSPPPPPISSQHQQQWVHPDSHLLQHHPPVPPLYPQPMPPYAAQPMPPPPPPPLSHHQYSPYPPHHVPPPLPPHQHRLPSPPPPPPPSAYPPPPPPSNQGWGGASWAQHQGWEYLERNLPYNNEDDWAARAKAWVAANSVTDNHQTHSQVMPVGRVEDHGYAYHDQYQAATGPPTDTQQSSLSQSTSQQLPHYVMDQQKQVNHFHGSASFSSGLTSYVADSHLHCSAREEAIALLKDHESPARNFRSTSSIYEQEVPYSYSSIPGNRDAASQMPSLPVLSVQEGFIHPQSGVEQPDFTHGRQPSNFLTDASNKPLDFEPRSASDLEPYPKVSYGHADPAGSMGVMDHDAIALSLNAWNPSTTPGVLTQVSLTQSVTQPSLGLHPSPAFGGLPGPNFRPSVPSTSAPFSIVNGTSINQAAIFSADASGAFSLSERPKKAAVPNWLREEIIKNKSVIASTYAGPQSGSSYNSMGSEDHDQSYKKSDQADNKSVDSTKSTEDDEDDEDDAEAAKSAAINQEIKRVLTEVLLKVTGDLFDEVATKVLNEDEPTDEVSEHKELGNHNFGSASSVGRPGQPVPIPVVLTPTASAKVLVTVQENKKDNSINESSGLYSLGGDILGLASYASDEEDDDVGTQNSKSSLVEGSNDRSSGNEPKNVENIPINKGEPVGGPHDIGSKRMVPNDASQESSATNPTENSLSLDASIPDGKLHNHEKEHKGFSDISSQHVSAKSGLSSEFSPADPNAPQSKGKATDREGMISEYLAGNGKVGKSVNKEDHIRECKNINSSNEHPEKRSSIKESVQKEPTSTDKANSETSNSTETVNHQNKSKLEENIKRRNNSNEISQDRSIRCGTNARDSDSRSHGSMKDNKKGCVKDRKERDKEDAERKKEKVRDEKESNSRRVTKDSSYSNREPPSPSHRGRKSKESSLHGHGIISSDVPSEISKKRKLQSRSPSPTRSRTRQVSRSPHRKHSHRRHSPYSSSERRRRSRSSTPVNRRR